jgi:hypothetical protein
MNELSQRFVDGIGIGKAIKKVGRENPKIPVAAVSASKWVGSDVTEIDISIERVVV